MVGSKTGPTNIILHPTITEAIEMVNLLSIDCGSRGTIGIQSAYGTVGNAISKATVKSSTWYYWLSLFCIIGSSISNAIMLIVMAKKSNKISFI